MRRTRARPLPDGRVPPADARLFGIGAGGSAASRCWPRGQRARRAAGAGDADPLSGRLHAAQAPLAAVDAGRRRARRAAAAHRLDGGARLDCRSAAWRCSPSCSSGRFPISWRSRGCTATTTRKAGFPMLPVIDPDGRRAGRQAVVYAAALLPASLVPTAHRPERNTVSRDRACARRRAARGWRSGSRERGPTIRRGRCSSARSPTCR